MSERSKSLSAYVAVGAALLFSGLWVVPVRRSIMFLVDALDYYQRVHSNDSAIDLRFSIEILVLYMISMLGGYVALWLTIRRLRRLLVIFAVLLSDAVLVQWVQPEEPIVFMSSWSPMISALLSVLALGVAIGFKLRERAGHGAVPEVD